MSEKAQAITEQAKLELTSAAVVSFTPEKKVKPEKLTSKPAKLEMLESVEVDSELADDLV